MGDRVALVMSALRIAGALAALLFAAGSCRAHGLQANTVGRGYRRAASVVQRATAPRVVVHVPATRPPAAHRPSAPPPTVLAHEDCSARRLSPHTHVVALATSGTAGARARRVRLIRTRAPSVVAAVYHDAHAPPFGVSSVIRRSA